MPENHDRPTRALSIIQPWATLIMLGAKTIETRSWATPYRGPLGIHASKGFPEAARALCDAPPFRAALTAARLDPDDDLPRGALLGVATLVGCVRVDALGLCLAERERAFGDYTPGRYAWVLQGPRMLAGGPETMKGALGIWTVPNEACA